MASSFHRVVATLSFASYVLTAFAFPFGGSNYGSLSMDRLFARQSANEFDPEDLSYITRMAAVGDSYSAGIGAGERLGSAVQAFIPGSDYACSRYDQAYPYLVHTDGAEMDDIHKKQILQLDGSQQVIMISAGGNDAKLNDILNQCVFQWGTITKEQSILAKIEAFEEGLEWADKLDWDAASRGCDGQLKYSEDIINSNAFSANMDNILESAKLRLKQGYSKFFGEEMTSECDKVSWATWIYKTQKAGTFFQPESFLTREHRETMNRLVDLVNSKIAAAVKRAGPEVEFVDYDRYVGETEGRFCEPGVDEGSATSGSRAGLMFFEMNGEDPSGSNPWKRSEDPPG
ncbi:ATPase [Apiospora arundinis]